MADCADYRNAKHWLTFYRCFFCFFFVLPALKVIKQYRYDHEILIVFVSSPLLFNTGDNISPLITVFKQYIWLRRQSFNCVYVYHTRIQSIVPQSDILVRALVKTSVDYSIRIKWSLNQRLRLCLNCYRARQPFVAVNGNTNEKTPNGFFFALCF